MRFLSILLFSLFSLTTEAACNDTSTPAHSLQETSKRGDSTPCWLTKFNDRIFFVADSNVITADGSQAPARQLYFYDASTDQPILFKDANNQAISSIQELKVLRDKLYLIKPDMVLSLDETFEVKQEPIDVDLSVFTEVPEPPENSEKYAVLGNKVFFVRSEQEKSALYLLEGDQQSKIDIGDIDAIKDLEAFNDSLYFTGGDTTTGLYQLNPQDLSLHRIRDINRLDSARLYASKNYLVISDYDDKRFMVKLDKKGVFSDVADTLAHTVSIVSHSDDLIFAIYDFTSTGTQSLVFDLTRNSIAEYTSGLVVKHKVIDQQLIYQTYNYTDYGTIEVFYNSLDLTNYNTHLLHVNRPDFGQTEYFEKSKFQILNNKLLTISSTPAGLEPISIDLSSHSVTPFNINPFSQRTPLFATRNLLITKDDTRRYQIIDSLQGASADALSPNISSYHRELPKPIYFKGKNYLSSRYAGRVIHFNNAFYSYLYSSSSIRLELLRDSTGLAHRNTQQEYIEIFTRDTDYLTIQPYATTEESTWFAFEKYDDQYQVEDSKLINLKADFDFESQSEIDFTVDLGKKQITHMFSLNNQLHLIMRTDKLGLYAIKDNTAQKLFDFSEVVSVRESDYNNSLVFFIASALDTDVTSVYKYDQTTQGLSKLFDLDEGKNIESMTQVLNTLFVNYESSVNPELYAYELASGTFNKVELPSNYQEVQSLVNFQQRLVFRATDISTGFYDVRFLNTSVDNSAPSIDYSENNQSINSNQVYSSELRVTDAENDQISVFVTSPEDLAYDADNRVITGEVFPFIEKDSIDSVKIVVDDGVNFTLHQYPVSLENFIEYQPIPELYLSNSQQCLEYQVQVEYPATTDVSYSLSIIKLYAEEDYSSLVSVSDSGLIKVEAPEEWVFRDVFFIRGSVILSDGEHTVTLPFAVKMNIHGIGENQCSTDEDDGGTSTGGGDTNGSSNGQPQNPNDSKGGAFPPWLFVLLVLLSHSLRRRDRPVKT